MLARGSIHGLLVFATPGDEHATQRLSQTYRLGQAMADSMSLALSNISLRETLRMQALRDPLTGLFNRRYMEDSLDRDLAWPSAIGGPISVVMIDIDHFKKLNDTHGHQMGDEMLKLVARRSRERGRSASWRPATAARS